MMNYSNEEKASAKKTLPGPLSVFFDSQELKDTYALIAKTFKLNLRQMALFTDAVEVTLLGLEPQTNFAGNVKMLLPELPHDELQNLLAYADEHLFADARKHLMTKNPHAAPDEKPVS